MTSAPDNPAGSGRGFGIGQLWANHHVMFDHIRRADRGPCSPSSAWW